MTDFFPAEYKKYGYQANQDQPGNLLFDHLFRGSPNAKVILTVRDSDEIWLSSFIRFLTQEAKRFGNPGHYFMNKFNQLNWMGPKMAAQMEINHFMIEKVLPGFDSYKRFYFWQDFVEYLKKVFICGIAFLWGAGNSHIFKNENCTFFFLDHL